MSKRPVIFLGTNSAIAIYLETCQENGMSVHGIIDQDYFGNTETICGIPVIDSETAFDDPAQAEYYRNNFDFFCATNWMPMSDPVTQRNRQKRDRLLALINQHQLNCVNIIDQRAKISPSAQIGHGCYIAEFAVIEPNVTIGNFVNIWSHCIVGHNSTVGHNTVIQRKCNIISDVCIEENVYLSMSVCLYKSYSTVKKNTFVHECVYLKRSTISNEIIGLAGTNPRRVTVLPGDPQD